jgi:hypothetical protein
MINIKETTLENAIKILTDDYMINSFYMDNPKKIKHLETIADLAMFYLEIQDLKK